MVHPRIVPWFHDDELQELKNWFYDERLPTDMRFRAVQKVKSYQSKGSQHLPHVIASTAQITNSILLDQERSHLDKVSVKLSYTMSLIRFVNGVLDPTQQSQFAIPLHTLAKRVGLPSWFVDLRHWGTHERDLPSLEMLRIAAKDALIWLWDHYWNDDELEEDGNEEDENGEDEQTEKMRRLFWRGKSLQNLLKEYSWYWEDASTNLISSTNFRAEEPTHVKRRREPTPQEQIDALVSDYKSMWNDKDFRPKFTEIFIQEYASTLLRVLVAKLPAFDQVFLQFLQQNYSDLLNKSPNLLSREFNTWETLRRKLLIKFVSSINTIQFVNTWTSWERLVLKNPSLLTYTFCQMISNRLADNRDSFKKKKKKRQFLSYQEVEEALSDYVGKYEQFTGETKLYDELAKAQVQPHSQTQPVPPAKSPIPNDMTDILKDLESLKRRHTNIPKTKTGFQWNVYPDWKPRPFGTL